MAMLKIHGPLRLYLLTPTHYKHFNTLFLYVFTTAEDTHAAVKVTRIHFRIIS